MPSDLSSVHVNRALNSLSVMLENADKSYLLKRCCGRRKVRQASGAFFQYGMEAGNRSDTAGQSSVKFLPSLTAPGAPTSEGEFTVTQKSYAAHRYAKAFPVTDTEIREASDPLSPLQDAAKMARAWVMNDAEGVLAAVIADKDNYNASNFVTLTTGANGTSWNKASAAGTGSEPLTNIRDGRIVVEKNIMMPTNTLVLSAVTKYHLADHDDLKNVLQYTDENYISGEGIPEHMRGLRIVTGKAVANTAKDGAAFSGDYLFADNSEATAAERPCAIIAFVPEEEEIGVRGFASFIWLDCPDETTGQYGLSLRAYRDERRRCWLVEAAITFDVKPGIVDGSSKITGAYMVHKATIP